MNTSIWTLRLFLCGAMSVCGLACASRPLILGANTPPSTFGRSTRTPATEDGPELAIGETVLADCIAPSKAKIKDVKDGKYLIGEVDNKAFAEWNCEGAWLDKRRVVPFIAASQITVGEYIRQPRILHMGDRVLINMSGDVQDGRIREISQNGYFRLKFADETLPYRDSFFRELDLASAPDIYQKGQPIVTSCLGGSKAVIGDGLDGYYRLTSFESEISNTCAKHWVSSRTIFPLAKVASLTFIDRHGQDRRIRVGDAVSLTRTHALAEKRTIEEIVVKATITEIIDRGWVRLKFPADYSYEDKSYFDVRQLLFQ